MPNSIKPSEAGWAWLKQNRTTLPKNNHWVAATGDGMVGSQPTMDELTKELERKQIKLSDVCITFMTPDAV